MAWDESVDVGSFFFDADCVLFCLELLSQLAGQQLAAQSSKTLCSAPWTLFDNTFL